MVETADQSIILQGANKRTLRGLLGGGGEAALPESRQTFEVAAAQTSALVNHVFLVKLVSFECELLFIDKPMVTSEPAVPSAQLLGLGSKLYHSNMQHMLN